MTLTSPEIGKVSQKDPVAVIADQRLDLGGAELPLYASAPLDEPRSDIAHAVVVIHGTLRNADIYFPGMMEARRGAGIAGARSLVVAPQFLARVDLEKHGLLASRLACWSLDGWKEGALSESDPRISSFAALDRVLDHLADRRRYPMLRSIVVAGHSAGGQIGHRYAVLGGADERLAKAGIALTHVVANPSAYLYLTPERPTRDGGFAILAAADCPDYDDYKYGLGKLPAHFAVDRARLNARYAKRRVAFLLGEADNDPSHPQLDRTCRAAAQGPNRFDRGKAFHAYERFLFGEGIGARHTLATVPGVGHDNAAMFQSAPGLALLFP
ncbi:MAG: alpha/beta fold hydrolase [Alphaproteobacteria bacterium]|nr:alpha/beta fold hydrolase [Alphaproteobacteria bacterium]